MTYQQDPHGGIPQQQTGAPTPVGSPPPPVYQANDNIQPIPVQQQQQPYYPPQQQQQPQQQQGIVYTNLQPIDEKAHLQQQQQPQTQGQPQPQMMHQQIPMQQMQMPPPGQPMYVMTLQGPMMVQGGAVMVTPDGKTTATTHMVATMPQVVQMQPQPAVTNTTTVVHTQGGGGSSAAGAAAGGAAGGFCGACCGMLGACCCCCTVM